MWFSHRYIHYSTTRWKYHFRSFINEIPFKHRRSSYKIFFNIFPAKTKGTKFETLFLTNEKRIHVYFFTSFAWTFTELTFKEIKLKSDHTWQFSQTKKSILFRASAKKRNLTSHSTICLSYCCKIHNILQFIFV